VHSILCNSKPGVNAGSPRHLALQLLQQKFARAFRVGFPACAAHHLAQKPPKQAFLPGPKALHLSRGLSQNGCDLLAEGVLIRD